MLNPDFNKKFYINCDASDHSLGAVLYQEINIYEQVISFISRTLNKYEKNYTITERELLSIVFAVNKFRTYVLGNQVIIRTDHKAISFFTNCKLSHGRLTRWILALQEYDIKLEYIPGKLNKVADILSRIDKNTEQIDTHPENILKIYHILIDEGKLQEILEKIKREQQADKSVIKIMEYINDVNNKTECEKISKRYKLYEDLVFINISDIVNMWRLVVPESAAKELINAYHIYFGHFGVKKVVLYIKEHFYIKNIWKLATKIIRNCDICQRTKVSRKLDGTPYINIECYGKLDKVFIDLYGPLIDSKRRHPRKYVVIIADSFSKYIKLYSICKANTKTILKQLLDHYIREIGKPKSVITDHGTQFRSKKWEKTLKRHGIKTYKTSVYNPQSNLSERPLREVTRLLRTYCNEDHTN